MTLFHNDWNGNKNEIETCVEMALNPNKSYLKP